MKRLESNQTEQCWFCCPIHFTGVNCWRQDFRTVPFIYLLRIYDSIHVDQVYRKQHTHMYISKHINKQKQCGWDCRCFERFSLGFLTGFFHARVPSINAFFFFQETDCSSEAFKENINILLLLTGSFPAKPSKTTAHSLPKISRNLSSNGPTFDKKDKKGFLF